MSLFEVKPYDREVYEKELKDFLPQKILDVHTHVYLKEFFPPKPLAPGEVKRTVTWPSLVAADDSIEDLQETYRLMLPGKDVTALMFSNSGRSQQANDYVADASRRSGLSSSVAMRILLGCRPPVRLPGAVFQRAGGIPGRGGAADPQRRLPRDQGISEPFPQVHPRGGDPYL